MSLPLGGIIPAGPGSTPPSGSFVERVYLDNDPTVEAAPLPSVNYRPGTIAQVVGDVGDNEYYLKVEAPNNFRSWRALNVLPLDHDPTTDQQPRQPAGTLGKFSDNIFMSVYDIAGGNSSEWVNLTVLRDLSMIANEIADVASGLNGIVTYLQNLVTRVTEGANLVQSRTIGFDYTAWTSLSVVNFSKLTAGNMHLTITCTDATVVEFDLSAADLLGLAAAQGHSADAAAYLDISSIQSVAALAGKTIDRFNAAITPGFAASAPGLSSAGGDSEGAIYLGSVANPYRDTLRSGFRLNDGSGGGSGPGMGIAVLAGDALSIHVALVTSVAGSGTVNIGGVLPTGAAIVSCRSHMDDVAFAATGLSAASLAIGDTLSAPTDACVEAIDGTSATAHKEGGSKAEGRSIQQLQATLTLTGATLADLTAGGAKVTIEFTIPGLS